MDSSYTYDDGSTITASGDQVFSTPATDYGQNVTPGAAGSESWTDVLKNGFGRAIDYYTAKQVPQNTPARYAAANGATVYPAGTVMGVKPTTLLLGVLLIGGVAIAIKMANKS